MTADIKWGHHVTACGRAGVAMDVEASRVFVRFEDMSGAPGSTVASSCPLRVVTWVSSANARP
jgi:hypothetical protein